jgi:hypothetical protein
LQSVGDQQDEDKVVERELTNLALAEDAKGDQERDVDQYRTENQLPGRNAWQQG